MSRMRSLLTLLLIASNLVHSATPKNVSSMVIFDTDIGDEVDDAFALSFLLRSPEVKLLGVTTAFADTHLRARLASRFLQVAGRADVPVYEGPKTSGKSNFTQVKWAKQLPDQTYPDAISFILGTIQANPGQITLLSVAPLSNLGALIAKDPGTFRKLKRVLLMGGSINRGYGMRDHPEAEWNVKNDIVAAKAVLHSGVPVYLMPLDSTQIVLERGKRNEIFARKTEMTRALEELMAEWSSISTHGRSPTLFDAVTASYVVNTAICPTTAMRIEVDDKGYTRRVEGKPNAHVCLTSNSDLFLELFMSRTF